MLLVFFVFFASFVVNASVFVRGLSLVSALRIMESGLLTEPHRKG
jgi:hypothetical protein